MTRAFDLFEGMNKAGVVNDRIRYGASQKRQFEENGFILFPNFLTKQGLKKIRKKVDAIYSEKDPKIDGEWILNVHQLLPEDDNWMWEIATNPTLVGILEDMLGKGVNLYASQLHRKEPGGGTDVPWHQDGNEAVRTLWISLDDVSADNGGLVVLPGLHKVQTTKESERARESVCVRERDR